MSTTDRPATDRPATDRAATHKSSIAWLVGIVTGLAVALGLALAVASAGHPDTAAGIVTGGMAVVVLAALSRWRSFRATDRAGTATRIAGGRPDERDIRVHEGTLAIVGVVAIVLSGLASAATFLDVDATPLLRAMPFALLLTVVVAFVWIDRRS